MDILEEAPYGATDASQHQSSLGLLSEVAEYLSRLPAHPVTHAVLQRVQSHLNNSGARALSARLAMVAENEACAAKILVGNGFKGISAFTSVGAPVIAARLIYPTLRLESPGVQAYLEKGELAEAETLSAAIGREIASGVLINLSPIHPLLDRAWVDHKSAHLMGGSGESAKVSGRSTRPPG